MFTLFSSAVRQSRFWIYGTRTIQRKMPQVTSPSKTYCEGEAASRKRWTLRLGIALLGLVLNAVVAANMAPTADEEFHLGYGARILGGVADRSFAGFDSKM